MTNMTFENFVSVCKEIANNLQTICEVKEYPEYGWAAIAFMTDKFGGTYINLHYDFQTNEIVNWYGHKDAREIKDISFLSYFVKNEMEKEMKARDLNAVYNMVNAEY